eukprot:scaffold366302_cov36-Prasinocladus_malaysianus.AAC.1
MLCQNLKKKFSCGARGFDLSGLAVAASLTLAPQETITYQQNEMESQRPPHLHIPRNGWHPLHRIVRAYSGIPKSRDSPLAFRSPSLKADLWLLRYLYVQKAQRLRRLSFAWFGIDVIIRHIRA